MYVMYEYVGIIKIYRIYRTGSTRLVHRSTRTGGRGAGGECVGSIAVLYTVALL